MVGIRAVVETASTVGTGWGLAFAGWQLLRMLLFLVSS